MHWYGYLQEYNLRRHLDYTLDRMMAYPTVPDGADSASIPSLGMEMNKA